MKSLQLDSELMQRLYSASFRVQQAYNWVSPKYRSALTGEKDRLLQLFSDFRYYVTQNFGASVPEVQTPTIRFNQATILRMEKAIRDWKGLNAALPALKRLSHSYLRDTIDMMHSHIKQMIARGAGQNSG